MCTAWWVPLRAALAFICEGGHKAGRGLDGEEARPLREVAQCSGGIQSPICTIGLPSALTSRVDLNQHR